MQNPEAPAEQFFRTLSYFDRMNFAARAHARALFSVALVEQISPPSTDFSAYNHYSGEKEIGIWEFNNHEGGKIFQVREQVNFLNMFWG